MSLIPLRPKYYDDTYSETFKLMKFLFVFFLFFQGNKSSHTKDIAKKQQVLVPLRNMAGTGFGRNNPFISQTFHLEGTNEVDPLKDPTTIFLNGDNRADAYQGPLMSETQTDLRGDNEAQFQQSSLEDNNFSIDSSLFGTRNENYRDGGNGNENSDNGDAAYEDENQLTLPNDEQTSDRYFNPTPEEEDSEPSQTMVDYNNYDSHLISNAAVQGLPTLSSIVGSRLRALGTLNSLDLKHPSVRMPYYTSLVRPMLNDKATGVTHSLHFDAETTSEAAKKDNSTNVHSKHKKDASNKEEEAKRQEQEYKSNVQNAEMAANLAEAAKTLTKLVKKLTEHDAIIRKHEKELAAKKNQSEGLLIDHIDCYISQFQIQLGLSNFSVEHAFVSKYKLNTKYNTVSKTNIL